MSESAPTILVIDNDEGLVTAITTRLESWGYACIRANTGAQGLAACRDQQIDLVITDINMPMGNGIEMSAAIREICDVPIIIITGFRDEFRRELRKIRNVTIVQKPFDTEQLLELVEAELAISGCDAHDRLA